MTWLMSRHRLRIQNLQLHNFVKNDQKRHSFVEGFSSIKLTWIWKKTWVWMLCIFAVIISIMLNSNVCKFITSRKMVKMPQNIVERPFSIELTKIWQNKGGGAFWSQVFFNGSIIWDKLVHCWTASKTRPLLHLAQQNSMSPDLLTYLNWFTSLDCTSPPK